MDLPLNHKLRLALVGLGIGALAVLPASPTSAGVAAGGAGVHNGVGVLANSNGQFPPPCTDSDITYTGHGTVTVADVPGLSGLPPAGGAVYSGPAVIGYVAHVRQGPLGSYGPPGSDCGDALPIPILGTGLPGQPGYLTSFTIRDEATFPAGYPVTPKQGTSLNCSWVTGSWQRLRNIQVVDAPRAGGNCSVNGALPSASHAVNIGTLDPSLPPTVPTVDPADPIGTAIGLAIDLLFGDNNCAGGAPPSSCKEHYALTLAPSPYL